MGHMSVLIVDDEPEIRSMLHEFFEDKGYRVLMAGNGEQALLAVKEEAPGLVLLDIRMPNMDGVETLRLIKEMRPETVVVMISAYATIETAKQTLKLGAYDYIAKPFDLQHLERIVEMIEASELPSSTMD